jgi:hypothetical protein
MAEGQLGNDDQFSQLEAGGNDVLSKLGQVVLISVADLLDETVDAEPF